MQSLRPCGGRKTKEQSWYEAAGEKYKGHIYGIGNVDPHNESVESFVPDTSIL